MPGSDHWLAEILDVFDEIDQWLPGSKSTIGGFLYGKVPEANDDHLFQLADAWAAARDEVYAYATDVYRSADPILQGWSGDGAATNFQQNWSDYLQQVEQAVSMYSSMADMTSGFALEVETEKFMTALNLCFLLYTLIMIIATLAVSFGSSALAAPGAFAICKEAIAVAFREAIERIGNLGANLFTRDVLKNITARAVADKVAGQVFKDIIRKEMRQGLTKAVDAAARKALVRGAYQMRKELADKLAAQLAEKWTGKVAEDEVGRIVLKDISDEALDQIITDNVASTFGKEFTKYLVPKLVQGAVFMGGQDLLVQSVEVLAGDRSGFDGKELATSTLQGAVMGGLMGGRGYVAQMATGSLAGLTTAAIGDGLAVLSGQDDVHWASDLEQGAASGAVMGGFFHVQHGVDAMGEHLSIAANSRIGQETHLLIDSGTGGMSLKVDVGDLHIDRQLGGVTVAERGGNTVFFDASGRSITPEQATDMGYRGSSGGTGPTGRTEAGGAGVRETAPTRESAPGRPGQDTRTRGGGGDDGGPPSPAAPEHTTADPHDGAAAHDDTITTDGSGQQDRPVATDSGPVAADPQPDSGGGPRTDDAGTQGDHGGADRIDQGGAESRQPDNRSTDANGSDGRSAEGHDTDGRGADGTGANGRSADGHGADQTGDRGNRIPEQRQGGGEGRPGSEPRPVTDVDASRLRFSDPPPDHRVEADADHEVPGPHDDPTAFGPAAEHTTAPHDTGMHDGGTLDVGAHHDAVLLDGGPHDPSATPSGHPIPDGVRVTDGGAVWTSTPRPELLRDRDALDQHADDLLQAAGDTSSWAGGRPPRIEMRVDGINARTARHIEHLRSGDVHYDADGRPVPRARIAVIGRRADPEPIRLLEETKELDRREGVPYLDAAGRQRYEVKVVDGRLYDQEDTPLHGHYVVVTEPGTHRVYAMEWAEAGHMNAKHSTLLGGGDVASAGEMWVGQGHVERLDNNSGHYTPTAAHITVSRDILAEHGADTTKLDVRVVGPEPTAYGTARGDGAFRSALDELRQPGEIEGVRRIDLPRLGRDGDPDRTGTRLTITTDDGRVLEIDAREVHDFLTAPRPDGPDVARFADDKRESTPDDDLVHQGSDLLRDRIERAVHPEPERLPRHREEPAGPPRALADLDRALSNLLGDRPLLDAHGDDHLTGDAGMDPPRTPQAIVRAVRSISDDQVHADVDAAGLPPDEAARVKAALIDRRDAAIQRFEQPPMPEEVQRMTDAAGAWIRPDSSGRDVYDTIREESYRKMGSYSTGMTVHEAARALDDAAIARGEPGGYERALDDFLATPDGRAYHDSLVHLDISTSDGMRGAPDGDRFHPPDAEAAVDAGERQRSDWSTPQRDAIDRHAGRRGDSIDRYLRTDGDEAGTDRADAFKIQSAMRPIQGDLRLRSAVDLRDLGLDERGGLGELVGSHITMKHFLRVSGEEYSPRISGEVRLVVDAPSGTHAAWLPAEDGSRSGDLLLAAGSDLHVVGIERLGAERYELHVRVDGYEDPAALTGRIRHPDPAPPHDHWHDGPDDGEPDHHGHDNGDGLHRSHGGGRSNEDVWINGTDVPITVAEVHRVAEMMGFDPGLVRIELFTHPDDIRAMDEAGLAGTTPISRRGRVIQLGPAAFADHETLARTVAHEYMHVEQLRGGAVVDSEHARDSLEGQAYDSEDAAVERYRARAAALREGDPHDDPVLGGADVRPREPGGPPRVGLDPGRGDHAGDDAGRRGGPADDRVDGGVREPGGPADRADHDAAGTDDAEPGGDRFGPDRGGDAGETGPVRLSRDPQIRRPDDTGDDRAGERSDAGPAADDPVQSPGADLGVRSGVRGDVPVRSEVSGADRADLADRRGTDGDRVGDRVAERDGTAPADADRGGAGEPRDELTADRGTDDAAPPREGSAADVARKAESEARDLEAKALAALEDPERIAIEAETGKLGEARAKAALDHLGPIAEAHGGEMVGTEHMVKSAGSLARKFLSERKTGEDVDTFIEKAGDIVRFSMELPEVGYGVKSVLESLRELGYRTEDGRPIDVEGLKNFWERGNRFYGLNLTLRAPEPAEHLLELQFPTERSWLTGKKTHDWYEIFRQDRFDFDTRLRALLQILKINKFDGLPDNLPDRREDLPPSKKSGLSEWIRKSPDDWEAYRQELAENGRTVDDLLGEFGLTRDDIPRADTADIFEHGIEPPAQDRPIIDRDDSLGRLFGDKEEPPLGEFRDGLDFRTASEPLRAGMPADPNEAFARLHDQVEKISADQLARAESLRGDPKYWFAAVYHFVTRFELNMIDDGRYTYPIMKLQEVVAFERTFDVNIDHWIHGRFDQVEPNWRIAFRAAEASPDHWYSIGSVGIMGGILPPMKAHIDHDLARAIAAVYEHFYAPNGIPFEAFKPDFAAMKVVFDQASAALLPEILKVTRLPDLGRYEIVQRVGFPFIYDVARARETTWDRAGLIVSGHELGIHDQQGMQDRIEAYRDTRSVFSGHGALKISGEKVLGYDWNHQPGINDRIEARPDGTIAHAEVQQTVLDRIGMHSPDLAEVVRKLLDDPHPLNVTKALHLAAMHEHVIAKIEEIARGSALAPYDGDLQALLADHPGHGPLSEHVAPELNRAPGAEFTRLQEYVQEMKAADEVHTIGLDRTPEQTEALNGYADRLEERVLPAVNAEVESVADIVRASSGGPVEVNSRPKDVAGLDDKIVRMARGRKGSPGRPNYRVGDIIDAVGARMTVPDMAALRRAYEAVVEHFGVGDGGRIVEIDNMYADPKAKNPTYRVIPMVIKIEVDGHKYAFELQLTTLRASVAADIEHNSLYKRYIDITPEERDAIGRAFAEAAALDQLEMRDE